MQFNATDASMYICTMTLFQCMHEHFLCLEIKLIAAVAVGSAAVAASAISLTTIISISPTSQLN